MAERGGYFKGEKKKKKKQATYSGNAGGPAPYRTPSVEIIGRKKKSQ